MLTTFNLDEYVYHAMKAGASGFLLKDATREQLTTIKSHITRILARLGLRDRVQIAVYAYEHGIVRPGRGSPPAAGNRADPVLAAGTRCSGPEEPLQCPS
jgi:hypothetical protein